ncbi:MAG: class I SAM-dependent methyltransferase [Candidatus Heimdallarchaeaceae archaeon]
MVKLSLHDKIEFIFISIIHDKLYSLFINGEKMLRSSGLEQGNVALEVGCGPGFFTIPAAKIVGEKGMIYALDINPYAIRKVQKKIQKEGIANVKTLLEDVRKTTLEDNSVDFVFFFGVIHSLMDSIDEVLGEMNRVLKEKGLLVIQKNRKSAQKIINIVTSKGVFQLLEEKMRFIIFEKKEKTIKN